MAATLTLGAVRGGVWVSYFDPACHAVATGLQRVDSERLGIHYGTLSQSLANKHRIAQTCLGKQLSFGTTVNSLRDFKLFRGRVAAGGGPRAL